MGTSGRAAYEKYEKCRAPVDMNPNEIQGIIIYYHYLLLLAPKCGGCVITIRHSAVAIYADANWKELAVR